MTLATGWFCAALLATCAAVAAPAPTAEPPVEGTLAGPARCRYIVPEGMPRGELRWSGGCRAGRAHGLGLLRALDRGRVVQVFYGRLDAGQPVLGAVELEGGFKAGRLEGGHWVGGDDRNTLIQAFDEAAAAARRASAAYRKAGNAASARHYAGKAQQLAQQLD